MPSFFEFARNGDGFRSAPAMPVQNDARILFFGGCQSSIVIRVQQAQDFLSGIFSAIALKSLHVHARGVSLAQARRELHLAMDGIIVPDKSADEADDDDGRHRAAPLRGMQENCAASSVEAAPLVPGTSWPSAKMATSEKIEAKSK